MTLQQLEYILALDTYRHYVTAADKCFVTQPTITIQVKKLEDEIGVQIFDRSKTPLEPTPLGEIILSKARTIIQEVQQLKEIVNHERENLAGEFKIGIISTISPYIIPKFIGSFMQNYPDTQLDINEMQTEEIIKALDKGQIDIGILVTPLEEHFLREIPLYNEPFVYYGSSDLPLQSRSSISAKDIEDLEGLWLLNSGHCFRNQVLKICNSPKNKKNIAFQSGSIETLQKMVDNYGGFTLIPEMGLSGLDTTKVIHFSEPKPVREVSIVVHKSFAKENLLEVLRKEILKVVPPSFKKNERFMKIRWR
ncbi:MAG: LysR substrate-binding domain-containing protein [Microscillaceae bacterium]|jgi:LysR family hydrogen peroxide-inducible transcriptional activator|nr:LysR substrate-binding domain-containing protein [Microscillaceae bacterium]